MNGAAVFFDSVMLPIAPESISFRDIQNGKIYDLTELGEIQELKGARLCEISIKGFLPCEPRHYCNGAQDPMFYMGHIGGYNRLGEPVRFIYAGESWEINMLCSVSEQRYEERGGSRDIDYSIKLIKWVESSAKRDKGASPTTDSEGGKDQSGAIGDRYTVRSGDTLSSIAKRTLGDSSRWKEIYNINKDNIKNPNMIKNGQILQLPIGADINAPYSSSGGKKKNTYSPPKQQEYKDISAESRKNLIYNSNKKEVNKPLEIQKQYSMGYTNQGMSTDWRIR